MSQFVQVLMVNGSYNCKCGLSSASMLLLQLYNIFPEERIAQERKNSCSQPLFSYDNNWQEPKAIHMHLPNGLSYLVHLPWNHAGQFRVKVANIHLHAHLGFTSKDKSHMYVHGNMSHAQLVSSTAYNIIYAL